MGAGTGKPSRRLKKRLIILISSAIQGGAQNHVLNLVTNLPDEYDVLVVCPKGYLADRLNEVKIEVRESEINLFKLLSIRRLICTEQQKHEELVINTHLLGTAFWCVCATVALQVKKVATLHNPVTYSGITLMKRIAFPVVLRYVARHVGGFIAVSKGISASIQEFVGLSVSYIPNAVPGNVLKANPRDHRFIRERPKIAIIGRLSKEKGHAFFIGAAKKIVDEIPRSTFYIIGDGYLRTELEQQVKELKVEKNFVFTGFVAPPIQILTEIDLIIVASIFEGIPLALLEVMNMGIPVVSTNVGGIPDVIQHGHNGLLVESGDADAIFRSAMRLLSDEELYKKISANSKISMKEEFDYTESVLKYVKVLNDCLVLPPIVRRS